MKATVLTSLKLTLSTLSSRRNIQDLLAPTDLDSVSSIGNKMLELAANNGSSNNADSEVLLGGVAKLVHLTASAPVQITLSCTVAEVVSSLTFLIDRHMTITGAFSQIKVKNLSTIDPVTVKAILA